jgi:hypothetical protein
MSKETAIEHFPVRRGLMIENPVEMNPSLKPVVSEIVIFLILL